MQGSSNEPAEIYRTSVEDVYELGGELGKGAFSVVRVGRHRQTGEDAAVKIIPASRYKTNARAQAAIRNEVEAMRRIRAHSRNPCLISMLGVYDEPSRVSIVLERLDGGELFERIVARGHYTERDASQVLYKLALALSDCHEYGILHRDVKPENVLYVSRNEDAEIKLTDFGLSLLETGASVTRRDDNLVGTPGYVAPEVLLSRLYGPPCDVWACGVITYILLAGYPPFFPTERETLFQIIKKGRFYFHPDAWESISVEAKRLVRSMLTVDVKRRATLASILAHPWVANQPRVPAQNLPGTISRLKAFNAKRKWRAAASVVMLGARMGLKKRSRDEGGEERRLSEHGFTGIELETLRQAFFASAQGDVLSRTQLAAALSDVGFGPVPSDRLFDLFDADGNGEVDLDEFLSGISTFRSTGDKALRFCFDVYDRDGVGAINLEQLKSVLSCVMRIDDRSLEQEEAEAVDHEERLSEMFKRLDVDGNGTIDFDEFKAGVKREPLLVQAFLAPVQQGSLVTAPAARRRSSGTSTGSGGGGSASGATPGNQLDGPAGAAEAEVDKKGSAVGSRCDDASVVASGSMSGSRSTTLGSGSVSSAGSEPTSGSISGSISGSRSTTLGSGSVSSAGSEPTSGSTSGSISGSRSTTLGSGSVSSAGSESASGSETTSRSGSVLGTASGASGGASDGGDSGTREASRGTTEPSDRRRPAVT